MTLNQDKVTLAIAPTTRGFGYVVFENPDVVMDWGVKEVRKNKLRDCVRKARDVMLLLHPSVLIIEDVHHKNSRRSKRVRVLIKKLEELAKRQGIAVVRRSREDVLTVFSRMGAHNKDEIAAAVVKLVPELAPRLPPRRRIWESEHYNMGIFEAAALALTVFQLEGVRRFPEP